jgi:hypothetical protein
MRNLFASLLMIVSCSGCAIGKGLPEVNFEWFNLSTNEIWIVDVAGLPPEASPGRLMPSREENPIHLEGSEFNEVIHLKDTIGIKWKENGKEGWPSGVQTSPEGSPATGVMHEAVFKRADLGIPPKLDHAKLRFTYLGEDKWRVKLYGPTTTFDGTDKVKDFSPPYQKP